MATRDAAKLAKKKYDVLVIGGGITGACIAWDATLRGLRVALVERDDFGAATSANSLKTVHGGLRYLQDANLGQVRKMVRERQAFLRIAPHLVRPLPCLMPTYRKPLMRSKPVLGVAVKLNDLLSLDRNLGIDPARALPAGRILDRNGCLSQLKGIDDPEISGGVLWYDAQIHDSERMLLSFILSAVLRGADVVNYICITNVLREGHCVIGAEAEDRLTGQTLQIRARTVVNAAGAWVDEVLGEFGVDNDEPRFRLSTAMNLVTRQILPRPALAINSRYQHDSSNGSERSRILFIAPWREYSIVGTVHRPYSGRPDSDVVREQAIDAFLDEVNRAYPPAELTRNDVHHVHFGYLPAEDDTTDVGEVKLVRSGQVTDHAREGVEGLITAVGVKYTTARYLAEKTVDLAFEKLGRPAPPCRTRYQRLYGGAIIDWERFSEQAIRNVTEAHAIPRQVAEHLMDSYGSAYPDITRYFRQDACLAEPVGPDSLITQAEIVHAVRAEMAVKLSDVVRRRTALGSAKPPESQIAHNCAAIMADELGWDRHRIEREMNELYDEYTAVVS